MGKVTDESNNKYGRLTVLGYHGLNNDQAAMWRCVCECGAEVVVSGKLLRKGATKSCGCWKRDTTISRNHKHGCTHTRLYGTWRAMRSRCNRGNDTAFKYYGGKGISVMAEWNESFVAFEEWAMGNGYAEGLTIERIDTHKGYSPENCRWIPLKDQGINKGTTNWVTVNGTTKTMSDWARAIGIPIPTIFSKKYHGANIEKYIELKLINMANY